MEVPVGLPVLGLILGIDNNTFQDISLISREGKAVLSNLQEKIKEGIVFSTRSQKDHKNFVSGFLIFFPSLGSFSSFSLTNEPLSSPCLPFHEVTVSQTQKLDTMFDPSLIQGFISSTDIAEVSWNFSPQGRLSSGIR